MRKAENKTKKFVLLATYAVALLCLLAGLFLPLFNGKEMLALQLVEAFKSLINKADPTAKHAFTLSYPLNLLGIEKAGFDFMALVVVLYALVSALAVLALVPVILSVLNKGKAAKKFYYGIEVSALIVFSLFFVAALSFTTKCYNMVIAACGTAVALVILSGIDKGKKATVKIGFFILSAIAYLALFDIVGLLSKQEQFLKFTDKISPDMIAGSGVDYLTLLFANKISDVLALAPDMKNKALLLLAAITATVVLVNFFIDTVKLATGKDRKTGRIFDIARYGLEVAAALSTLITALICKYTLGLMLIAITAVSAILLAIAILRFLFANKKAKAKKSFNSQESSAYGVPDYSLPAGEAPVEAKPVAEATASETEEETPSFDNIDFSNIDDSVVEEKPVEAEQSTEDGTATEQPVSEEIPFTPPTPPVPDDDGYIDPRLDEEYHKYAESIQNSQPADNYNADDLEDLMVYKPESGGTYLVSENTPVMEGVVETVEEEPYTEPEAQVEEPVAAEDAEYEPVTQPYAEPYAEPVAQVEEPVAAEYEPVEQPYAEPYAEEPVAQVEEPVAAEYEPVAQPYHEPAYEVKEEPVQQVEQKIEPSEPYAEQTKEVQNPFREEVKPYNPYEKHNNPFRNFDEPPYNPYRQPEAPAQPAPAKVEQPAERPAIKPLQPRSIIQEFKPVPPVDEQPAKEPQVYTIDTIYAGPTDDFIHKLSNDERIEFAKTFIEKVRGNLGTIPDYVVGGNNKKFFSGVFIYLGRIRGMISDSLLNKMFKELNLL